MDNKLDHIISDNELFQSYGVLCEYNFIFNIVDENSFKKFDYNKYPKFADVVKKHC